MNAPLGTVHYLKAGGAEILEGPLFGMSLMGGIYLASRQWPLFLAGQKFLKTCETQFFMALGPKKD